MLRNSFKIILNYFKSHLIINTIGTEQTTPLGHITNQHATYSLAESNVFTCLLPLVWYESGWTRALVAVITVIGVRSALKLRLRYTQRTSQRLELLVAKRTEALQNTLDQLKESEAVLNRQMRLHSRLLASIVHDIQSPLHFVTYASRQAHQLAVNHNYELLPHLVETIASTTENTSYLLNDLLTYTRTSLYDDNGALEWVDLHALLGKKSALFSNLLHAKQNTFSNEVPAGFQVRSDSHLLGIIIHNLLDNAVKYTKHGLIRAHVCLIGQQPRLLITNQGMPMNAQTLAWFNGTDNEPSDQPLSTQPTGSGLLIIKELATMIDLKLVAQQTDVTTVHVVFGNGQRGKGVGSTQT